MTEEKQDRTPVFCNDECGAHIMRFELESSGWECLQIQQNRYRCVDCWRRLKEVNDDHNHS